MNPTTVDIKELLMADSSLGLTFGTNLFIGRQPISPDECVTLYDTTARAPESTLSAADTGLYEYPAIQVRVRANSYIDGYDLGYAIYFRLHNSGPQTIDNTLYSSIMASQTPTFLAWDENDRAHFIFNIEIQRR